MPQLSAFTVPGAMVPDDGSFSVVSAMPSAMPPATSTTPMPVQNHHFLVMVSWMPIGHVDVLLLARAEDHAHLGGVVAVARERDAVLAGLHRSLGGNGADRLAVDDDRRTRDRGRDAKERLGRARGEHGVDRLDLTGRERDGALEREVVTMRDRDLLRAGVHAEDRLTGPRRSEHLVAEPDLGVRRPSC